MWPVLAITIADGAAVATAATTDKWDHLFWVVLALTAIACIVWLVCCAMKWWLKWAAVAVLVALGVFLFFSTAIVIASIGED